MKEIAVIILNYNSWEDTIKEIEHIHNMFSIMYNDFIVIDNNSPNDSYIKLSEYRNNHDIILIKSEVNGGYAKGNNIGLRYAKDKGYKYALVVNNDIEFTDKNTLDEMLSILQLDENLATINTDIVAPNGKIYNRDSVRLSFYDMTIGMLQYIKKGRKLKMVNDKYAYVYRPQGCCFLADVEKLSKVDYFDEYTFLYNEEIILAERLLKNTFLCGCCPKYSVIHNTSHTIKNNIQKRTIINYYSKGYKYYLKKYRKFTDIQIKVCSAFLKLKLYIL